MPSMMAEFLCIPTFGACARRSAPRQAGSGVSSSNKTRLAVFYCHAAGTKVSSGASKRRRATSGGPAASFMGLREGDGVTFVISTTRRASLMAAAAAVLLVLAACQKSGNGAVAPNGAAPAAQTPLLISPEDVLTVKTNALA